MGIRTKSVTAEALDDLFAANLRAAREDLGLSRRALGERSGLSKISIEKIEGRTCQTAWRRVSIGEAVVLAEALGVKPGELLRGASQYVTEVDR